MFRRSGCLHTKKKRKEEEEEKKKEDRCDTSSHLRITVPSSSSNSKNHPVQMIASSLSRT